jgi:hypothetical protein
MFYRSAGTTVAFLTKLIHVAVILHDFYYMLQKIIVHSPIHNAPSVHPLILRGGLTFKTEDTNSQR